MSLSRSAYRKNSNGIVAAYRAGLSQSAVTSRDVTCVLPSCQATAPPHLNAAAFTFDLQVALDLFFPVYLAQSTFLQATMAFCITFGTHGT